MTMITLLIAAVLAQSPAPNVSFDLKDADLREFLIEMGTVANLNVVLHPAVEGKITVSVRNAPWEPLLDAILRNYGLGREVQGNLMSVAPLSVLQDGYKQRAAVEEARLQALPLEIRPYILNYAKAPDVARIISALLSPRGLVIVDPSKNLILVRDVAGER
jgi:type IV pilus assembly protein PilQ